MYPSVPKAQDLPSAIAAVNALSQQDDDQKVVEAFLDSISVQEATLLYREAMRRHGQTGDAS